MTSGRIAGVLMLLAAAGSVLAQTADMNVSPTISGGGGGVVQVRDPNDPMVQAYARQQKRRVGMERELKKIRFTYFRSGKNVELRQAGIMKLREFDDPAAFPCLLEIFRNEGADVRTAILDQLGSYGTDEADATLAWTGIFDHDKVMRAAAQKRLAERCAQVGSVSPRVQSVVREGLSRSNETQIAAAAEMADILDLYEAIPMMISAQVGGSGAGGGSVDDDDTGALAYILIGTQQAFVSDLTPVVGDSAVAFDPTLGVVTDGVFLRVIDAYVITYRSDVHNVLVRMTSRAIGRDTGPLGWDQREWRRWYREEFLPHRAAVAAAQKQEEAATSPPGGG